MAVTPVQDKTPKGKKTSKKSKSKTAATQAESEKVTPPANTLEDKKGISGLPLGTQVVTGLKPADGRIVPRPQVQAPVFGTVQYTVDSPFTVPATLTNSQKANLLLQLGLIQGLYAQGDAPDAAFIRSQGNAVTFRPQDSAALGKIMAVADKQGILYTDTIGNLLNNPALSKQYFGRVTSKTGVVPTTNPEALIAEMNSKYMDLFNAPEDKKAAAAYAAEINKAEAAAGLKGYQFSAQEKENIFTRYVQAAAEARYKKVKLTPGTEDDIILEQGSLGNIVRELRLAYEENGLPTSDRAIYVDALKGIRSPQALKNTMDNISIQAATQFPAFKEDILKGFSVKTLLSPYVSSYEKLYGKSPKITDFYSVAAGKTAIPVTEWVKTQYLNPEFKKTKFYQDTISNDLRTMAEAFGVNA